MSGRLALLRLLKDEIHRGDFTLASGAKSDWYLDCRPVIFGAPGTVAQVFCVAMSKVLSAGEHTDYPVIGAPVLSAVPIATAMGTILGARTFAVRAEPKTHGADQSRVVGALKPGDRCVVIDDVWTSGGSLCDAIGAARKHGAEVVGAGILVHRGRPLLDDAPPTHIDSIPLTTIFTKTDLGVA